MEEGQAAHLPSVPLLGTALSLEPELLGWVAAGALTHTTSTKEML